MVAGLTATVVIGACPLGVGLGLQLGPQLVLLLAQLRRGLGVDVGEQVHGVQGRVLVHVLAQGRRHGLGVLAGCLDAGLVEQAAPGQLALQQPDRVVLAPGLDLGVAAVAGRVIGVGVGVDAVGDRLDQGGAAARAGVAYGVGEHLVHGGGVVAVDQAAGHAVADGLVGQ